MEIALERILSLIPKKEDGDFKHGEKAKFAKSIGYQTGDIVSMWINGSSSSYNGKLFEISQKYGVSVEWLRGETDEKNPPPDPESGLNVEEKEVVRLYDLASPELRALVMAALRSAESQEEAQGDGGANK